MVGEATASALREIQHVPSAGTLAPRDIRGGSEAGTSEKLANFILKDLGPDSATTLLYMTGDKNRDTLPNILKDGGVKLESLQVYETVGSSHFEVDLEHAMSVVSAGT